jgi:hypothetical protein
MDRLKSLLLPLALVFAAIAVFETGVRYGATNMRAHAIAGELVFPLTVFVQGQASMDPTSLNNIAAVIDNGIAAGAMHRKLWYLDKDAKAALDKVLTYAFNVRGDNVTERIIAASDLEGTTPSAQERIANVLEAVKAAKLELIDNAPSQTEEETATMPEAPQAQ